MADIAIVIWRPVSVLIGTYMAGWTGQEVDFLGVSIAAQPMQWKVFVARLSP